jgi:NAD(P)H-hydrate epimerase
MSPPREIVTAAEMRRIDEECGIPSIQLMDNAAAAAVCAAERLLGGLAEQRIVIVAGKGNNAGDGFAMGRLLRDRSGPVEIVPLFDDAELSEDALANARRARGGGAGATVPGGAGMSDFTECGVPVSSLERLAALLPEADLVVDAIFGAGFRIDRMPDSCRDAIRIINDPARRKPGSKTLALDLPSGSCADTGRVFRDPSGTEVAVLADATITFGRPKRGLFLFPAASFAGTVLCDHIGIPDDRFRDLPGALSRAVDIAPLLPRRSPTAHKGASRLLIIGGSRGMTGAPLLAARAALASNTGYVRVALPMGAHDPGIPLEAVRHHLSSRLPEIAFDSAAESEAVALAQNSHAVVFGGGLGTGPIEHGIASRWTRLMPHPAVVDADALRLITLDDLHSANRPRILTPHAAEFTALFGGRVEDHEARRVESALEAAVRSGHVILYKGRPTIAASPDGRYVVNSTGDERLATLGSGDILAGIVGALLAQGLAPFEAAYVAAHLHGLTTKFWPHPVGLTASGIADLIPEAWGECLGKGFGGHVAEGKKVFPE